MEASRTEKMPEKVSEQERLLAAGYSVRFMTEGWSMYPLIVNGRDEVIVKPSGKRRLKRGDVVLYRRRQGILVLHRIHHINKKGVYFVGDNQKEIEGPLQPEQVKGILCAVIRNGKEVKTNEPLYIFYSHVWLALRPLRPFLSRTAAKIKKMKKQGKFVSKKGY